ncbi:hypothetical protein RND71_000594 [Anisodus tanguticus]|uniref:Uncharacterized protein n=1 Tax=Anisodus tanguticus TaxID=243964 RepID=A0AAE1SZ46_9SOLA|nr:hypothetical protein RND71_000594 [Anisodus tanguticus]
MNLRKKAETSAAAAEEKVCLLDRKLSSVSESIEREKSHLGNELEQLKSESKFSVTKISKNLERMEFGATNAEKESVLLKEQLEELRKRLDMEAEVHEARKLKSSHENIELLKEKGWREKAESELLKLAVLQGDMENLENELSVWKSMVKDIPGASCADDVPPKFAALQREVLDSMTKVGEIQAQLKQMEVALDTAELEKRKAENDAVLAKEKAESSKSEIKRIELKISLQLASVIEERDRLKNVIEDFTKQKSVESASLAKKENCIKELESSLSDEKDVNIRQRNEIKFLNEKLNNEAKRIKSLEREGDRLRSEIALLESKLGDGDYSSANTKVLRMVNTLGVEHEAKQTIEALQNELQKTKEQLLAVQELKGQSGTRQFLLIGSLFSEGHAVNSLDISLNISLRAVSGGAVGVCCWHFFNSIFTKCEIVMDDHQRPDGIPVTRFMLQSIYAQSDDEKLGFEYESGNTNILVRCRVLILRALGWLKHETDLLPSISTCMQCLCALVRCIASIVEIFIRRMNSIPAFTANLTVESFNKRTLS